MKIRLFLVFVVLAAIGAGFICIRYYSYVFAKKVEGEVTGVERVTDPAAVIGGRQLTPEQIHSFAVAIRNKDGEIYTASSEDRQWAVVRKGQCAQAEFFPYPPWDFQKAGTFFGARLLKLKDCPTGTESAPAAISSPAPSITPDPARSS